MWRAGLDLNPLDVTDPADVAWLEALIWPEHAHRRDRLRAAVRSPRPTRRCWCAATWSTTCPRWPPGHHRRHSRDLPYLGALSGAGPRREAFTTLVRRLPGHWISVEGPDVLPFGDLPEPPGESCTMCSRSTAAAGLGRPHGQAMAWFAPDRMRGEDR